MGRSWNIANMEVDSVFINISGGLVTLFENRGVIAVTKGRTGKSPANVRRVMQAARIFTAPGKEIVDLDTHTVYS